MGDVYQIIQFGSWLFFTNIFHPLKLDIVSTIPASNERKIEISDNSVDRILNLLFTVQLKFDMFSICFDKPFST